MSFDSNGWLTRSLENPSQVETILERDGLGRVAHQFDRSRTLFAPTGKESFTTWRVDGLPDTMTEHGVTTTYIYDAMGK